MPTDWPMNAHLEVLVLRLICHQLAQSVELLTSDVEVYGSPQGWAFVLSLFHFSTLLKRANKSNLIFYSLAKERQRSNLLFISLPKERTRAICSFALYQKSAQKRESLFFTFLLFLKSDHSLTALFKVKFKRNSLLLVNILYFCPLF